MSPPILGKRMSLLAARPISFAIFSSFITALGVLLFWATLAQAQGQRRGPAQTLSAPARAMPARPPARARPVRVQRPAGRRPAARAAQRGRSAAFGAPRRAGVGRPSGRPGRFARRAVRPGFGPGAGPGVRRHRFGRHGYGHNKFGRKRFGRKGLQAGLVDPLIIPYQQPADIPPPAAEPYPEEAEPYRVYRQRCVAPKIIKAGPIIRQPGSGPRLIYGSRNPCGPPVFVDRTRPKVRYLK